MACGGGILYRDMYLNSNDTNEVTLKVNGVEVPLRNPKVIRECAANLSFLDILDEYIYETYESASSGIAITGKQLLELSELVEEVLNGGEDWEDIFDEYFYDSYEGEYNKKKVFAEFRQFLVEVNRILKEDGTGCEYRYVSCYMRM